MKFVTFINAYPDKYSDMFLLLKSMHVPDGISIISSYFIFGKPDAMVIFECGDESKALKFVETFAGVGDTETHVLVSVERI
ncbi:MAG: DUF3303 family protein [Thermoplasmata archaeon]|jgi:uncharacterized protein with GYD domain|nr:hypothetical protein [Thermoplasmatales archaeon]